MRSVTAGWLVLSALAAAAHAQTPAAPPAAASAVPAAASAVPAAPVVKVETRAVPGRDVKQVTAQALVPAPPHVLRAVIADLARYPAFMPYVKESRVLRREAAGDVLNYQRLSFGMLFVQDRHYVIRIAERRGRDGDGRVAYAFVWTLEPGLPDDVRPDGAIRVSVNNGFWDLHPARDADGSTDVRYCVFTDPAGALPKWAVGLANSQAVPDLFAAVAREAATPRYATQPAPDPPATLETRSGSDPALSNCSDAR